MTGLIRLRVHERGDKQTAQAVRQKRCAGEAMPLMMRRLKQNYSLHTVASGAAKRESRLVDSAVLKAIKSDNPLRSFRMKW